MAQTPENPDQPHGAAPGEPSSAPAPQPLPALRDIYRLLDSSMVIDRIRLGRRAKDLARLREPDERQRQQIAHLASLLQRSVDRCNERKAALPSPQYPSELPVVQSKDQIAEAIRNNQVVVVCGATGSGKTTQLPKICLELGRGVTGMIGHTQPRRIAARSVAARIAEELGARIGGVVGYKVRFTDQVSRSSLVKLMTDGILLAETQNDRLLAQYDTIIIDEAHERSLNIDFLLGYIRQLLPKRPDLKLIVTSATIDPQSFAEHFSDPRTGKPAPVIEVSGRAYPVEVRYRPLHRGNEDAREIEMEHAVVQAAAELIGADKAAGGGGPNRDILVFLPGEREIRETADELRKAHALRNTEVIPLFARLSTEDQNKVFQSHDQRRIILATNVAETSLTVPGIKYVIDSGLARISRYSPRIKVQRLPIEPISQASAQQRTGRCGRTSPGIAIRLFSEEDFNNRPVFTDPEILRTNLASVILQMKALGLTGEDGRIDTFPFMQPPNPGAVRDGYDTLVELGAIDAKFELTDIGRKLARLPVDPRIGRMVLAAVEERCIGEVLIIAAALSVQDPRERPADRQDEADTLHEKWRDPEGQSDFLAYLNLWRGFADHEKKLTGSALRRWCRANLLSYVRLREWQDIHRQLKELAEEIGVRVEPPRPASKTAGLYDQIHRALLAGLLSNIGTKSPEKGSFEYDGARGIKFSLFPGSALFKERPKWVVAAELVRTTRLYARTAAAVQPQWIEKVAAHLVTREYVDPHWSADTAQVAAYENVTLFGLPIVKRRRMHYGPVQPEQSRTIFIEHALVRGEYLSNGRFQQQNFATQQSIQRLEEKKRQTDLLADPCSRFQFYSHRVPEGVFDGPGFERWRQRAEARQPEVLVIPRQEMLAPGAVEPTPDLYPDALFVESGSGQATARIPLEYKHKHNDPDDGVTAIIPLALLPSLDPARFDWLVPGFAREKITELIRSLPKPMRVNLAPAAGFAERAINELAPAYGRGDFLAAVAAVLTKLAPVGVTVSREALAAASTLAEQEGGLPTHLKMNFRIMEELPGKPVRAVASGRDLRKIKRDLAKRAEESMSGLPEGTFNRGRITIWDFGPPPATIPTEADLPLANGAGKLHAFIALADETPLGAIKDVHPAVGIRPFSDPRRAALSHRSGVIRLLAIDVAKEARSLIDTVPGIDRILSIGAPLVQPAHARKNLAELTALEAFAQLDPALVNSVRDKKALDTAMNAGWDRLGATGRAMVDLAAAIFTEHHQLALTLESAPEHWKAPIADIRHQLEALFISKNGRWLVDTPFRWLQHFPRYLQAARLRLQRLPAHFDNQTRRNAEDILNRDAARMNELLPLWSACIVRLQHTGGLKGRWDDSDVTEFRWLIEELRVSLFAQELRTATPIGGSSKKLAERWAEIAGEGGEG